MQWPPLDDGFMDGFSFFFIPLFSGEKKFILNMYYFHAKTNKFIFIRGNTHKITFSSCEYSLNHVFFKPQIFLIYAKHI